MTVVPIVARAGAYRYGAALKRALLKATPRPRRGPPAPSATELNTENVAAAAAKLGIDARRLPGGFLELRRRESRSYCRGSDFAVERLLPWLLCGDKWMTSTMLAERGLPVSRFASFTTDRYEAAVAFLERGNRAVVTKPTRGTYGGAGVTVGIRTEPDLGRGFAKARVHSEEVMVEDHVEGEHLRVTILGQEVLGVVRRIPARVAGDGLSSIGELIAAKNALWSSGARMNTLFRPIQVDAEARRLLRRQGLTLDAVPDRGQIVHLREVSNADQGGEVEDVEDYLHPEYLGLALSAARVMGPMLSGVDLIVSDLRAPPATGGVVVNEVNTSPSLYVAREMVDGVASTRAAEVILRRVFEL